MTRSRTKNALIQLLETIPVNLLTDSETECEDNVLTDNNNETDVEEDSSRGYKPELYVMSIEEREIPFWNKIKGYVTEVTVDSTRGATVPVQIGKSKCNALIDTGVSKSVMSEEYFQQLMLPDLRQIYNINIKSTSGSKIKTTGITTCTFSIGKHHYTYDFVVCKNLSRPFILGIDKI